MNKTLLSLITAACISAPALADWTVNNDLSRVSFVSVKKDVVGESHYFKQVSGTLTSKGQLSLSVPLASVETMIPIRNERMQKFLFETNVFPTLEVMASVPMKKINGLKNGQSAKMQTSADIALHGVNKMIEVEVMVTRLTDKTLQVVSMKPVNVKAADYGLDKGIEKLRDLAKLPSITGSVPVSFILTLSE